MDPIIRRENSALLFKLQTAEDSAAVPTPGADAIPIEADSFSRTSPFRSEGTNETSGSLVAAAPLVIGQAVTVRFRARVKGANAAYTASVKPPLHPLFAACGLKGLFTAAIAGAALAAGGATTATLGAAFAATAQAYKGMPLVLTAGVGNGHQPLVIDYTAGKVATLSDSFSPALDITTVAGVPANWTYAGTSPRDAAARATDHPCGTLYFYEDGLLHQLVNVRGRVDFEGESSRPGYAAFEMTGTYVGDGTDAALPSGLVLANHSAPLLVKGTGLPPAALVNRKMLPIASWSSRSGGAVESPDDPNTDYGFGSGQITGRAPTFECDPLATLRATRNILSEIRGYSNYPIALRFGSTSGNRWTLLHPAAQPVGEEPGMRGRLRSESLSFAALPSGRDTQDRDGDLILSFS